MAGKRHEKTRSQYFKSGVLPFRVLGDEPGTLEYLLGKESEAKDYKFSNTWSAFEGGSKPNEAPEGTAAREYLEESCGCFNPYTNLEGLVLALHRRKYTLRVTIRSRPDSFHKSDNLFALQVPTETPCVPDFTGYQERLRKLVTQSTKQEKQQKRLEINPHFLFRGSQVASKDKTLIVTKVCRAERNLEKGVDRLTVSFRYQAGTGDAATLGNATLKVNLVQYTSTGIEDVKQYIHWHNEQRRFESAAAEFVSLYPSTVAVDLSHSTEEEDSPMIKINTDCLEKSEVKWWSADEIEAALQQKTAKFRPSFMRMFRIMNKALQDASAAACSPDND